MHRNINLILALILSGGIATSFEKGLGIGFVVILSLIWFFFDKVLLSRYEEYTSELIRKEYNKK